MASAECKPEDIKRFGKIIVLKDDCKEKYLALHADGNAGVRDLLQKYNLHNFNIFMHTLPDGKTYEFMYYEYRGTDFDGDMALLNAEPRNIQWLSECDPTQETLDPNAKSGGSGGSWVDMTRIYFNP